MATISKETIGNIKKNGTVTSTNNGLSVSNAEVAKAQYMLDDSDDDMLVQAMDTYEAQIEENEVQALLSVQASEKYGRSFQENAEFYNALEYYETEGRDAIDNNEEIVELENFSDQRCTMAIAQAIELLSNGRNNEMMLPRVYEMPSDNCLMEDVTTSLNGEVSFENTVKVTGSD